MKLIWEHGSDSTGDEYRKTAPGQYWFARILDLHTITAVLGIYHSFEEPGRYILTLNSAFYPGVVGIHRTVYQAQLEAEKIVVLFLDDLKRQIAKLEG